MSNMKNINRGPQGWVVRFVRDGEEYSRYFRFSDGGIRKSLANAKKWRDQQLKKLGPRQWRKGPRKKASNNTSGVTGVSKNAYGRWVATWQEDGKQRFKTFKKKKEAVAFRNEQIGE
ncbi:MAG: hypothetical protein AB8G99_04755 [Planctomycetaceae bacterium]